MGSKHCSTHRETHWKLMNRMQGLLDEHARACAARGAANPLAASAAAPQAPGTRARFRAATPGRSDGAAGELCAGSMALSRTEAEQRYEAYVAGGLSGGDVEPFREHWARAAQSLRAGLKCAPPHEAGPWREGLGSARGGC